MSDETWDDIIADEHTDHDYPVTSCPICGESIDDPDSGLCPECEAEYDKTAERAAAFVNKPQTNMQDVAARACGMENK